MDLQVGIKWFIELRKNVRFWEDCWLGDIGPLKLLAFAPIDEYDLHRCVRDYVVSSSQ